MSTATEATEAAAPEISESQIDAIADLLPQPHCTIEDLVDELDLSRIDCQRIRESQNITQRHSGGSVGYRTRQVAREIIALGLDWNRTPLSVAREQMQLVEIFNPATLYPAHQLPSQTGVPHDTLCEEMELRQLSGQVDGGKVLRALERLQAAGVRIFVSADTVRRAIKETEQELTNAAEHEPIDLVDDALRQRRLRAIHERDDRRSQLLSEYAAFVRRGGDLSNSEIDRLGELAMELGLRPGQYSADVAILQEVGTLEKITPEDAEQADADLQEAIDHRKRLEKQYRELPEQIRQAATAIRQMRDHATNCKRASERVKSLREEHSHLFGDPNDAGDSDLSCAGD